MSVPRIFVCNDDGIDSVGLHVLARALTEVGDVTIVAPDQEFSGAGAAIGALHLIDPEARKVDIDGIDEAWAVNGPPAQCMMFVRLGTFGPLPDLVVSGINPGANVGRAVYHSGTVGAALTSRHAGVPSLAISQSVPDFGILGQGSEESLTDQHWDAAATVAATAAAAMLAKPPPDAGVLNINVPNLPIGKIQGWDWASIAHGIPRSLVSAELKPKLGHEDAFRIEIDWGSYRDQPQGTDAGVIQADRVSLSWLSRLEALDLATPEIDQALGTLGWAP